MNTENLSLKEMLNQTTLYEVYENNAGELEYKLDSNGDKIEICEIGDIEFEKIKLYPDIQNTEIEYIATYRMGSSEVKEDFLQKDLVNWFTIDDLTNIDNLYIENTYSTKSKISLSQWQNYFKISSKKQPIQKGNILVSFKMTIGTVKIYNSDNPVYCNEAIDIVDIVNKTKYYNKYIALFIGKEYLKYTQSNVGSTTLNSKLKDKIFVKIPKSYKNYSFLDMQMALVKNIEEKLEKIKYKENILRMLDTLNQQQIIALLNNFFDNKTEDSIIVDGVTIKLNDIEFEKIQAHKSNEYFIINNGQRLKKADLEENKDYMIEAIEVYSASEFDNHVFGYIEKEKLESINPNQHIYEGETILLNTGGSVGAIRYKKNNFKYTVIDNVVVYVAVENKSHPTYLYYALLSIMDNSKFNYNNTLRGNDLSKANLIIKVPKYGNINTYKLQKAISKYLEDKIDKIGNKLLATTKLREILNITKEVILNFKDSYNG